MQTRTTVVRVKSSVTARKAVQSNPPELIDDTQDPGDLTLLFDNKLI